MTIANDRLKQFFSKQRVGAFDALKQKGKPDSTQSVEKNIKQADDNTRKIEAAQAAANKNYTDSIQIQNVDPKPIIPLTTNELIPEPLANREQTVSIPLAYSEPSVSKPLANCKQTVIEPLSPPLAKPLAKTEEIHFIDLRNFSKKERDLLSLIFWQCHNNCTLISPPISTEEIRHTLKISAERVRNLIFRIVKKGGLKVTQHKSGQSAYREFELSKSLYQCMIDQQDNRMKRLSDPLAQPLSNPLANNTYSSSIYNNKTTTVLPEDWKKINFEPLEHIGFSEMQLRQLWEKQLNTPEIIQESINHFAFALENNPKVQAYGEPLNVLIGVLRKGQQWRESNYISATDLALQKLVEDKKKIKEKRDCMIKEIVELEFPEWKKKLTDSQIKQIVPEEVLRMNVSAAITASLRTHYVEKILLPRLEKDGLI